jgi:alanyl-tRNA synthetase
VPETGRAVFVRSVWPGPPGYSTLVQPYQEDSYRITFESNVAERRGSWVRLKESCFYPTAGGQPHDTGVLESAAGQAVVAEVKLESDHIWHYLEGPLPEPGMPVTATLDWERRYRHMQRHSAQHLLSGAFVQLSPAFETRSVSLLGAVCTLDLAGEPQEGDLDRAERLVNQVAYANLEIRSFEVHESELEGYPLRRPPKVSGRVRLVQMGDFELSACGGTHLRRTAEALPLKLLGQERVKGGLLRVRFSAGWEALDDYRAKHDSVTELARDFSAQPGEVSERVEGMRLELAEMKRALALSRHKLAQSLAKRLREGTADGIVVHPLAEEDADLLGPLSQELIKHPGTVALLGAVQGSRAQLLFACHEDGSADMRAVLNVALEQLGGRGGGSAARAQGGGAGAGLAAALEAAAHRLRETR